MEQLPRDLAGVREGPVGVRVVGLEQDRLQADRVAGLQADEVVEHTAEHVAPGLLTRRDREIDAADAVAFGDMPNDLPMLAWAGTSYAVANADPMVLAAATHITESNDDDGVAMVLDSLLPRRAP